MEIQRRDLRIVIIKFAFPFHKQRSDEFDIYMI